MDHREAAEDILRNPNSAAILQGDNAGNQLKIAHVHAMLYVGDQLGALLGWLDQRPITVRIYNG